MGLKSTDFAFPFSVLPEQYQPKLAMGLTKREYFAAMALAGIVAIPGGTSHEDAELAVATADALIQELSKEVKKND